MAELFEFVGRERRLTEDLRDEAQHRRQVLASGLDLGAGIVGPPNTLTLGLQPVDLVLNLLAGSLGSAAHQHVRRQTVQRRCGSVRLFSSPKRSVSFATTVSPRVFFGQQRDLQVPSPRSALVRDSMFAGDGSNASPAATTAPPL